MPNNKIKHDPMLNRFDIKLNEWIKKNPFGRLAPPPDSIGTSVCIFNPAPTSPDARCPGVVPRILLIQRSPEDRSMKEQWEVPGGGVDMADQSILSGAAREVREEAGLEVTSFLRFIPVDKSKPNGNPFYYNQGGNCCVSMTFLATVRNEQLPRINTSGTSLGAVKLSHEHISAYWATEDEVKYQQRNDGTPLPCTVNHPAFLQGFNKWREIVEEIKERKKKSTPHQKSKPCQKSNAKTKDACVTM